MTFTLVSVVYATAICKPGHGVAAPLAIGFTLFASAFVGEVQSLAFIQSRAWSGRLLGPGLTSKGHAFVTSSPSAHVTPTLLYASEFVGEILSRHTTVPVCAGRTAVAVQLTRRSGRHRDAP
jgi:hypothetical protein